MGGGGQATFKLFASCGPVTPVHNYARADEVLKCLAANVPLHGRTGGEEGVCIEMCQTVVADLQKALQETSGPAGSAAVALGASTPAGSSAPASGAVVQVGAVLPEGIQLGHAVREEFDPAVAAAEQKVLTAMTKITYFRDANEANVKKASEDILGAKPLWIIIDAQTSKTKVVLNLMEMAALLIKEVHSVKHRVIVFCGRRVELQASVYTKAQSVLTATTAFPLALSSTSKQWFRSRGAYALVALTNDVKESAAFGGLPLAIDALAAKALPLEQCGRRCVDLMCKFRDAADVERLKDMEKKEPVQALAELNRDDVEDVGVDEDVEEAPKEETDDIFVPPEEEEPEKRLILDWNPFHFPKDFYKRVVRAISPTEPVDQLAIFTTTPAPGSLFAAHDLGSSTTVFLDRVKDHGFKHGKEILQKGLLHEYVVSERKKIDPSKKRVTPEEIQYFVVQAPMAQAIFFHEVTCNTVTPSWRATVDEIPNGDAYEQEIVALTRSQFEEYDLFCHQEELQTRHGLHTKKSLKEGATIGVATVQLFTSLDKVLEFFNTGGNAALLENPLMKIANVKKSVDEDVAPQQLYALIIGAFSHILDKRVIDTRKPSNVEFKIHPEAGANDGLVTVHVKSHNGCGIRKDVALAGNFGEHMAFQRVAAQGPNAKRFRNVLSLLLQGSDTAEMQAQAIQQSAANHEIVTMQAQAIQRSAANHEIVTTPKKAAGKADATTPTTAAGSPQTPGAEATTPTTGAAPNTAEAVTPKAAPGQAVAATPKNAAGQAGSEGSTPNAPKDCKISFTEWKARI